MWAVGGNSEPGSNVIGGPISTGKTKTGSFIRCFPLEVTGRMEWLPPKLLRHGLGLKVGVSIGPDAARSCFESDQCLWIWEPYM